MLYCVVHSLPDRVALCPFPDSGLTSCHQCDVPLEVQRPDLQAPLAALFCDRTCEDLWLREHPGYFGAAP